MRPIILLTVFVIFSTVAFGQQRKGYAEWIEASKTDIRMLPMYGHQQKTDEQIRADLEFINTVLEKDKTPRAGSEQLIKIGFDYLYQSKLQTAMFRFNQAWLLDSTNANVFWGFGSVYFYLSACDECIKMYKLGLLIDSMNTNLLTDLGAIYLAKYDQNNRHEEYLTLAISYLEKSYKLNPKNGSTVYKLIMCSLYSGDCKKAKKYLKECEKLDGIPITDEFRQNIKQRCS